MTISLRAAGTPTAANAAVTAINPSVPTGTTTGDLSVLTVTAKPYDTTITTPTDWVKIGEATNGTVASGVDSGSTKVAVYVRLSAPVGAIGAIDQSGANSMGAVINSYATTGSGWDYSVFTSGGDSTDGANYSATGGSISVANGDWLLACTAVNTDLGTTSGQNIAIGSVQGGTSNRQTSTITTGNDSRIMAQDAPIIGATTATPVFTYTNASSTSGTTLFLRLRDNNTIPRTGWVATADSVEISGENAPASNALDGSTSTFWHTKWQGGADPLPHWIKVDMGKVNSVEALVQLPRQDGTNGRILQYEVHTSLDDSSWTLAASGTFADNMTEKTVAFTAVDARYVRLTGITESSASATYSCVAELNLRGTENVGVNLSVPVGEVTVTGYAPAVELGVNVEVPAGSVTIDGLAPAVTVGVDLAIPVADVTITGFAPGVSTSPAGTITLQGTPSVAQTDVDGTTLDVPYPSGVAAGELLTAHFSVNDNDPVTDVPTGWTLAESWDAGNNLTGCVYYKVATGSESGNVTFTAASTYAAASGMIIRWSGVDTTTPLDTTPVKNTHAGTSLTIQQPSMTTVNNNVLVVSTASIASSGREFFAEDGWTIVATTDGVSGRRQTIYTKQFNSPGATGTVSFDASGSTNLEMSVVGLPLRPSSAVPVDISVPSVEVTVSGHAPDVTTSINVDVPTGVVTMSAPAAQVSVGVNLDAPMAAVTITAPAPSVTTTVSINIDVPAVAATVTGHDPVLGIAVAVDVPTGVITVTGHDPSITGGVAIDIPTGVITLTGYAPAVDLSTNISVPLGVVTITGLAPTLSTGVNLDVPTAAITVTGYAPGVSLVLNVPKAEVNVLAYPPTISVGVNLAIPPGTVTVDGWAPQVDIPLVLAVPPTSITVTGHAPTFQILVTGGRDLSFDIKAVPVRPTTLVHKERHRRFTIYASAGERELVGAELTEINGEDISTVTYHIALGSATQPQAWQTPDENLPGDTVYERTVKMLVSSDNAPPGYYYIWIKVTDAVEIPLIRVPGMFRVR